jgi:hypothetical protein
MVDKDSLSEAEQHRQRLLRLQIEEDTHWHLELRSDRAFWSDVLPTCSDLDSDVHRRSDGAQTSPALISLLFVCFVAIWTLALVD